MSIKFHFRNILLFIFAAASVKAQGIELEWQPNTEADLAGYKVYWGTYSGFYSRMQSVGLDTSFTLTDFAENGYTYVAVTAYDTNFNESGYSTELVLENAYFHHQFVLQTGYPNPSNPSATFPYRLSATSDVHIAIYDVLGREIAVLVDKAVEAGEYTAFWSGQDRSGRDVASGTYFCRMRVGQFCVTQKIIVLH